MDIPPLFVHPSVDTHLSCFPLEVIMNQVFMEIFTSSRDLNFRKSGSTLVVQWLGLSPLAKKQRFWKWNVARCLDFCCKVVPLFQDCSSGEQMSVASFSASLTTKFPQKTPQENQRVREKAFISETWLPLSPKNATYSLETNGSCQLREENTNCPLKNQHPRPFQLPHLPVILRPDSKCQALSSAPLSQPLGHFLHFHPLQTFLLC